MNETIAVSPSTEALQWVHTLRSLAKQAGCETALIPRLQALAMPQTAAISVAVMGAANTGKSALVNALLDRKLLPSSPIPSERRVNISATEGEEAFVTPERGPRPLGELAGVLRDERPSTVEIQLRNAWLSSGGLHLIEARALDTAANDPGSLEIAWQEADLVVLVITALMPVRRSEALLLLECRERGLPIVVAVTRTDDLPEEDRTAALAHIKSHVTAVFPELRMVEVGRDGEGAARIRDEILRALQHTDFESVREERLRRALLPLLGSVRDVADDRRRAASEAAAATESVRREQENGRAVEARAWLELEAALHERRIRLEEQARRALQAREGAMVDNLTADLHRSNDVKGWWHGTLPGLFSTELRNTATSLSEMAERRIATDVQWLTEEVRRRFQWTVPLHGIDRATITSRPVGELTEPELSDAYAVRLVSMIGTSATLMAAAVIAVASTGGLAVAVGGVLGGGAAEIYRWHATKADRIRAGDAVQNVVKRAVQAYVTELSGRLLNGYDAVLGTLKEGRLAWQLEQQEKVLTIPRDNSDEEPNWEAIVERLDVLAARLDDGTAGHTSQWRNE